MEDKWDSEPQVCDENGGISIENQPSHFMGYDFGYKKINPTIR